MNTKKFEKEMKKEKKGNKTYDYSAVRSAVKKSVERTSIKNPSLPNGFKSLVGVSEECGELIQEISKFIKKKDNRLDLLQELADVQLGLYYVQEVCGISDEELELAIRIKLGDQVTAKASDKMF